MRREATPAERKLWLALRNTGLRFTRQLVVGSAIIDIACRSAKLAIELDGGQHGLLTEKDAERTRRLGEHGWTVLRFWNNDALENVEGVVAAILTAVAQAATHPRPLPYREGR